MSNRYSHSKQQRYVPKTSSSPTLSNSLRQPDHSAASSGSSSGRPSGHANGGTRAGSFMDYLPQDEAVAAGLGADKGGLDPVEAQRVVDSLNRELARLLKLNPKDFWREVASDNSLPSFLESFLKFRSRWYDFPYRGVKGIVAGVIVGEHELSRRVFMVLYRISSNRDPGAKASFSLNPKDHEVILQDKKLLDLPKLLDICAIYSHENEDLTRLMVGNAIKSQPKIYDNFTAMISHFLNIVHTMYHRCNTSLEVLLHSHNPQDGGTNRLTENYLEVMDFINDAIVSLDAFVGAYKQASVSFACPVETSYGNDELLKTLARLHDSLLPSLQQGLQIIFATEDGHLDFHSDMFSNVSISLKMLSSRIVKFGWKLLYFCYLSGEVFGDISSLPATTKIFPAQVEDPVIRADILVQAFREISEESSAVLQGKSRGTLLQSFEKNHMLMSRIELLQNEGWISMDSEQMQLVSILFPRERGISCVPVLPNNAQIDEDTAIIKSKISQVKDLFPDYGEGFISACLEVYNQNPEEVIQRILEGTLHEDLLSLDTSLQVIPSKSAPLAPRNDKGKGKLIESSTSPFINEVLPSHSQVQLEGPSSTSSSSSSAGRYVRKSATTDFQASEILDTRDERNLAKTAALASLLEYEDEYDDSFDDLGLSVGDSGLEDTELLSKTNSSGNENPPSNANRWGSRQKPQFFVKDGKNYSYKVSGSVGVANYNEASLVNRAQKDLIHGLGRGGNFPIGAAQKIMESNEGRGIEHGTIEAGEGENSARGGRRGWGRGRVNRRNVGPTESNEGDDSEQLTVTGARGRGNSTRGRGRGREDGQTMTESNEGEDNSPDVHGRGNSGTSRGRGRRGGRSNNYRKDQAMKKHFSGLGGY